MLAQHHHLLESLPNLNEYFSLKKKFFLIEGQLLYRILLFSVKPKRESAIDIHVSPAS